jgi:hypothetical protein
MPIGIYFKEIYIHLIENEPTVVCTVRYGGLIERSTKFSLEPKAPLDLPQESLLFGRLRNRHGDSRQSGR